MMKLFKKKKTISIIMLLSMMISLIPIGSMKVEAHELKLPRRYRPTVDELWNPEHLWRTANGENMFIGEYGVVKFGRQIVQNEYVWENLKINNGKEEKVFTGAVQISASIRGSALGNRKINAIAVLKEDGSIYIVQGDFNSGFYAKKLDVDIKGADIVTISIQNEMLLALLEDGRVISCKDITVGTPQWDILDVRNIVKIVSGGELSNIGRISYTYYLIKEDGQVYLYTYTPYYKKEVYDIVAEKDNGYVDFVSNSLSEKPYPSINRSLFIDYNGGLYTAGIHKVYNYSSTTMDVEKTKLMDNVVAISGYDSTGSDPHRYILTSDGEVYEMGLSKKDGEKFELDTSKVEGLNNIVALSQANEGLGVYAIENDGTIYKLTKGYMNHSTEISKIQVDGRPLMYSIPEHQLYKINIKSGEIVEGGKTFNVEWELISSSPVDSFDIYYAYSTESENKDKWIPIATNISVNELNTVEFSSNIKGRDNQELKGYRYNYKWTVPNEFTGLVKLIIVPNYK